MGTGKTSLVLRFVKGKFFDNQVKFHVFFLVSFLHVSVAKDT